MANGKFEGSLVPKGKTIQEQNTVVKRDKMLSEFQDSMDDYFDFIETGLNLYDKPMLNPWSENKEEITIQQFLKITKENVRMGFTREASNVLYKSMTEMIDWIGAVVSPTLLQQSRVLDEVNRHLENVNESYKEELKVCENVIRDAKLDLEQYDKLKQEYNNLNDMFRRLFEINFKLMNGETKCPAESDLANVWNVINEVVKKSNKVPEQVVPNDEDSKSEETETDEEDTETTIDEDDSEPETAPEPAPPNRNRWIKKGGSKK